MAYQQNSLLLLETKLNTFSYDEKSQQILEQFEETENTRV
jgi:hypothetical protein